MSHINGTELTSLLLSLLHHCLNATTAKPPLNHTKTSAASQGVFYILLVLAMFSFFSFAVMFRFIRSRKLEGSQDPYQQYIARDWSQKRTPNPATEQESSINVVMRHLPFALEVGHEERLVLLEAF
uniref:Potassium voltage-gated channel, Isk-related family, member 1 n=1 Tax=Hippocampus comes TaxID=109280 RepID=A0A3Q2XZJ2_HIPCM